MSHHSSDYESAAADLVEYYGQPISYIDPSLADPVDIDAIVHPERTERRKMDHGWIKVQARDVFFDAAAVTTRLDGTFTIGDQAYSVDELGTAEGNRTAVKLKRATAGEISRPKARG